MCKTRWEKEKYQEIYAGIRNYSGGFITKGKELGVEIVPAACAYLCPSGHITDEALEKHRDGIVSCDSPGIHCANLRVFDFKFTNTSYFPLQDAEWNEE